VALGESRKDRQSMEEGTKNVAALRVGDVLLPSSSSSSPPSSSSSASSCCCCCCCCCLGLSLSSVSPSSASARLEKGKKKSS